MGDCQICGKEEAYPCGWCDRGSFCKWCEELHLPYCDGGHVNDLPAIIIRNCEREKLKYCAGVMVIGTSWVRRTNSIAARACFVCNLTSTHRKKFVKDFEFFCCKTCNPCLICGKLLSKCGDARQKRFLTFLLCIGPKRFPKDIRRLMWSAYFKCAFY